MFVVICYTELETWYTPTEIFFFIFSFQVLGCGIFKCGFLSIFLFQTSTEIFEFVDLCFS